MLKYRSLFASLALLFECVDFVDGVSKSGEVREESALRAAAWCSYLESHVIRIYSPLLDTPERRAHNLLERLKMGDVRHGTKTRHVWRKGWTGLNTAEDLAQALDILEPLGWVRRVMIKSSGAGRPSERLHLHPELRD